jgi:prepilin-type N-terminal cleavage/methylation domain-containing protein
LKNSKGFTLVEAMIAVALVGVAVVMIGYLAQTFGLVRKGQLNTTAVNYARTLTESTITLWRKLEFYQQDVLPTNLPNPSALGSGATITMAVTPSPTGTPANYTLACSPVTNLCNFNNIPLPTKDPKPTSKQIDITISNSAGKLVVLSTVVSKPQPS